MQFFDSHGISIFCIHAFFFHLNLYKIKTLRPASIPKPPLIMEKYRFVLNLSTNFEVSNNGELTFFLNTNFTATLMPAKDIKKTIFFQQTKE